MTVEKTRLLIVQLSMIVFTSMLQANEPASQKTIAINYEEGKTPEALFHKAFQYYQKLVAEGTFKSAEFGTSKVFGEIINFQTAGDDESMAKYRVVGSARTIRNMIKSANQPYNRRFYHIAENHFFGDKSLGYAINPYRGCYNHDYLAKGLEQSGYKIIDASENPDITMTIGIDACMTEDEFKEYIQKNTSINVVNKDFTDSKSSSTSIIGNDLMRSGSSAQLATPSGGGNAGMAVAGIGLALNIVNWMNTKAPQQQQERDVIRYHVKFEGKDKQSLEYYPVIITKDTHKEGDTVYIGSYYEAENFLFTSFLAWNSADKKFGEKLPPLFFEKDILKMTEMMVAAKTAKQ